MMKRQRVDATLELILRYPQIERENDILRKLLRARLSGIGNPHLRQPLHIHPTLYKRFRTKGFPLKTERNRKLPQWRSLSPWMKYQLAAICIGEHLHLQIRLTLHDELRMELVQQGKDLRVYIRDRLRRVMKDSFDPVPWFYFVIEDLDASGQATERPHVHGMIQLPFVDVSKIKDGRTRASYLRIEKRYGERTAKEVLGKRMLKKALKQATGNTNSRPDIVGGISQASNLWSRKSYMEFGNPEAVSYAFKNFDSRQSALPENRRAISQDLITEARRFWELVRVGEPAMKHWPNLPPINNPPRMP